MRKNIIIISILAMLMLAGSLIADTIYVHVTNVCTVTLKVYESGVIVHQWPDFIAYPNQDNPHPYEPPIPGIHYLVEACGETALYSDCDSGLLGPSYPDNLHLYLDVSGKIPDKPSSGH